MVLRILLSQAFERASAAFCALIISASFTGRGIPVVAEPPGGLVWPVAVTRRPPTMGPVGAAGPGFAPGAMLWASAGPGASRRPRIAA